MVGKVVGKMIWGLEYGEVGNAEDFVGGIGVCTKCREVWRGRLEVKVGLGGGWSGRIWVWFAMEAFILRSVSKKTTRLQLKNTQQK